MRVPGLAVDCGESRRALLRFGIYAGLAYGMIPCVMIIGIPREIKEQEYRVSVTPAAAYQLIKRGH